MLVVALVIGVALAWLAIALLRPFAPALGLIDAPGGPNGRKTHKAPTPVIGGLGIALGLAVGLIPAGAAADAPWALLLAMAAIVLLGVLDDRSDLPKPLRFAVQLAVGCAVALAAGVDALPLAAGVLGVPVPAAVAVALAGVAICALINAVNWLDGIDGMLGVLVLITLGVACVLPGAGEAGLRPLVMLTAGTVLGFLWFNLRRPGRPRAVVFLGDAGSGLLAVILGYVMLSIARTGTEHHDPLLLVAAGNGLFFADMAFVMGTRILTHGQPWKCDRSHLHHRLTDRGFTVTEIVLVAASAHALFLSIQTVTIAPALGLVLLFALALTMLTTAVLAGRRSLGNSTAGR